jgi:dTDP-4-amino-4,6-dideoxygalactose transaminase
MTTYASLPESLVPSNQNQQTEKSKIWLSSPHMSGNEQKYINEAFESNWVAPLGKNIDEFENQVSQYTGTKYAAAVTTGTAALQLALRLVGVSRGDYVICQSLTFVASANAILYQGAQPIFVDSETKTWGMDPELLEKAILHCMSLEKKPKAIVPVHLYGMPVNMVEIMRIAKKYRIPVIEDAAEALGSSINGKMCGSFGDFGIISFNGNKIITTSGGGMLLSDNPKKIEKAKFLATQARENFPHYQHEEMGYNFRMSNVLAGIGRGQMEVLKERIESRRSNFNYYKEKLGQIPGISFLKELEGSISNRWLTIILLDPKLTGGIGREDLRLALAAENIESRPLWKPMHMQPLFESAPYFGKGIAMKLFKHGLCLPSGSNLTNEELDRVIGVIKNVINN